MSQVCTGGRHHSRPSKPHSGKLWLVSTFNEEKVIIVEAFFKYCENFREIMLTHLTSFPLSTQPLAFSSKALQLKVPLEVVKQRNTFLRPKIIDANQICLCSPNLS